ncbi:MAG: BatA domain-containing protein [Planctomycetota bacterium]
MSFLTPALLGLTALFTVPLAIHLLNRRRFQTVPWAAMDFLLKAYRRNRRRLRLESILLLTLRCLIPVLLALAVARPRLGSGSELPIGQSGQHHVLVLDRSYSMGYGEEGIRRPFDRMKELAEGLVGNLRSGQDRVSVVFVDERVTTPVRGEIQTGGARRALSELQGPGDGRARLLPAIEEVVTLIGEHEEPGRVYVLSDFQRSFLEASDAGARPAAGTPTPATPAADGSGIDPRLVDRLGDLHDRGVKVLFFPLAPAGPVSNSFVRALRVEPANIVVRGKGSLQAEIHHRGPAGRELLATMTIDGSDPVTRPLVIPPGDSAFATWDLRFLTEGQHVVEVGLSEDGLPIDDVRRVIVDVRKRIRVLCVEGGDLVQQDDEIMQPSFLFRELLGPLDDRDEAEVRPGQEELLTFEVRHIDELRFQDDPTLLQDLDVLCLIDVAGPREEPAKRIAAFVERGGGLLVAPGASSVPDLYNLRLFGASGDAGPLPLRLLEIRGSEPPRAGTVPDRYATPLIQDPESPILRDFVLDPDLGTALEAMPVYRWWATDAELRPETTRIVLGLRGADADVPLLAVREYGRGRAALLTSWPSTRPDAWNELDELFVALPLLHSLAHDLARRDLAARNLLVGQPLVQHLEHRPATLYVTRPRNLGRSPLGLPATGQPDVARFDPTYEAGLYRLEVSYEDRTRPQQEFLFAVNPNPREGVLAYFEPGALQVDLPDIEIRSEPDIEKPEVVQASTGELGRFLLILVLAVGLGESVLASLVARRRR